MIKIIIAYTKHVIIEIRFYPHNICQNLISLLKPIKTL